MGLSVLAWCLMDNHAHLLLRAELKALSDAMKRLGTRYARYHNRRTGHVGHVYSSRFKSEPVEDDGYLLTVVRYIHNNPREAGICEAPDYRWSSYAEYVGGAALCDTSPVLGLLGSPDAFRRLVASPETSDRRPISATERRPSGEKASRVAREVLGGDPQSVLSGLPKGERDELLRRLKDAGLSIRQTERITGIGRNTVARAYKGA